MYHLFKEQTDQTNPRNYYVQNRVVITNFLIA